MQVHETRKQKKMEHYDHFGKKFSLELSKGLEGLRKDFKARKAAFDMRSIIDACKFLAIFYYKE